MQYSKDMNSMQFTKVHVQSNGQRQSTVHVQHGCRFYEFELVISSLVREFVQGETLTNSHVFTSHSALSVAYSTAGWVVNKVRGNAEEFMKHHPAGL